MASGNLDMDNFFREIMLFLNLRTVRSITNKIVKKLHSAIRCHKCIRRLTSQSPQKPPSNLSGRHHSIPREIPLIKMTCHYLDLGSASNWLSIYFIQSEALLKSTIGAKIVETLYSNRATTDHKKIHTPPPPLHSIGVFVDF